MSAANFILKTTCVMIGWNPKEAWECRVFRLRLPKAKTMAMKFLKENGNQIMQSIREGTYKPKPVRRVEIPKPGGGKRLLGIPTVLDRVV
jgi:hypothetical protein